MQPMTSAGYLVQAMSRIEELASRIRETSDRPVRGPAGQVSACPDSSEPPSSCATLGCLVCMNLSRSMNVHAT